VSVMTVLRQNSANDLNSERSAILKKKSFNRRSIGKSLIF
jgi:hypothetical protein